MLGCGGSSTAPQAASLKGLWTSPTAGQFFNTLRVQITIEVGNTLSGDWTAQITGTNYESSGYFWNGARSGDNVSIPLTSSTPSPCNIPMGVLAATLSSPNTLSGTFVRKACNGNDDPPVAITLTR